MSKSAGTESLAALVAELEQAHDPLTDEETAAARSEWP